MDNQGELFSFWDSYQNIPDAFKIIESGIDSLIHKNSEQLALPPTLNFKIKFRGEGMDDDFVDVSIANYVIQLQQKINEILELNRFDKNSILVKVKVEKGCKQLTAFLDLAKIMNSDPGRVAIAIIGATVILAPIITPIYLSHVEQRLRIESHAKSDEQTLSIIKDLGKKIGDLREMKSDLDKPMRDLIKSVGVGVETSINGQPYKARKDILEELKSKRNPRSEFENVYIDGKYKIIEVDGEKKLAKILINDLEMRVSFSDFSRNDTERLITLWGQGGELSEKEIDLQITLECNAYSVKSAKIIEIGKPRTGAISPESLEALKPNR